MSVPLSRPPVDDEIKAAVLAAIDSRQYILGPECKAFEQEFARYLGCKHAVLTSSATAAIWMGLRAFGVKADEEVLVPSHTAFPTVEAICFAGARPIFVDVNESYTVDLEDAAAKVSPRTVGFVPVHLYGHPADLDGIRRLCAERSLWLLEDCAQAHGAAWQGRKVGTFGRAGVFSFYPSKNLTVMGDGGLLVTDDDNVAARCRRRRAGLPLVLPAEAPGAHHVYHLYVVRTPERDGLAKFLKERGIATGIHYPVPSHQQPAVEPFNPPPLPRTERIVTEILTLPISAGHTEAEVDQVVAAVTEFFRAR